VQEPPLRPEEPPSPETPRADEPLVPVGEARVVPGVREPVVPVGRQRPEPVEEAAPAAGPWQTLAIVSPSREDGGAERYLRVIAAAARRRGWAVHAAFPSLDATRTLLGDLQALGIECHGLAVPGSQPAGPAQALRVAAAEARGTLRVLGEVKPTTILTVLPHPDQAPGLVLAAAAYPARAVTSVHLVPPDLELTDARRLLYTLCRGLRQRWIAVSPHSRRELARALRWSERRIDLVHNGVGGDAPRDVGADIRAELGLPPETKLLLTVGRLNRQKGHDVLAESIGAVSRRHPQAHWAWAGDGPARAALTAQLERLGLSGRVSMLGVREDVPRLLAAADLFLFPSRYEGAPLALLEAMAAGVPVIVSDSGPLPEIVRDGVEGLVVRGEDAGALAQATCWALEHENEMSALAAAALRRVASEFSRERMVAHTLALLTPGVRPRRGAVSPALLRTLAGTARLRGAR
jgi:glycosyltransferase involved in cell wall biosynthesis